jgi:hypothetical protein
VPVGGGRKKKHTKAATTNETTSGAASKSNTSELISNNNNSAIQRLFNGNPSSSIFPEILNNVLFHPAQHVFPLSEQPQLQTISPDFEIISNFMGRREIDSNNLGSYTNNLLNDTFSISGYAQTGIGGDISVVPPMQLNTGNWSKWNDVTSWLANPDVKPPTNEGL